jgi:hypothetical protein
MRAITCVLFLLALGQLNLCAQTMHVLLFDTEGLEEVGDGVVIKGVKQLWSQVEQGADMENDEFLFYAEFGDRGGFDSEVILRVTGRDLAALFESDSLMSPVSGTDPGERWWLEDLAVALPYAEGQIGPLSVTLITLNESNEYAADRRRLLHKLAVVLARTSRGGGQLHVDTWNFYNPLTNELTNVWE